MVWKTIWNLLASFVLFLGCVFLAVDDYLYQGEILFHASWPLIPLIAVMVLWVLLAHILAIFPKRFLFPVLGLFASRLSLGFPFNWWMDNNKACLAVSLVLAAVTAIYFLGSLFQFLGLNKRDWFRWKHSLGVLLGSVLLGLISIPVTVGGMIAGGQNVMGDYTRFSFSSISMLERVFSKDGTKVFLIGMMHIGEGSFYSELNKRMGQEIEGRRVVLTEGVADRHSVLPKSFVSGETYGKWAERFGLKVQNSEERRLSTEEKEQRDEEWAARGVELINADIDVSELSPEHQATLVELLKALGSNRISDLLLGPEEVSGQEIEDLMMDGLIGFRNQRLMEVFAEVEEKGADEIYIPWGAAHLPGIEERLVELGYQKLYEESRPVVRFWNR